MMNAQVRGELNNAVLQRVYSEFSEMPGLHVTCKEAQRLWSLDEKICGQLLNFLVEVKFLYLGRRGRYLRLTDGRGPRPRLE
jgi:hypothetical protein